MSEQLSTRSSWQIILMTFVAVVALAVSFYVLGTRGGNTIINTGTAGVSQLTAGECKQLGGTVEDNPECTGTGKTCVTVIHNPVNPSAPTAKRACINEH